MKNRSLVIGTVIALVFIIAMIPATNAYEIQAAPVPVVVFDGSPQSGVVPLNVTFISNSTIQGGGTLEYLWDFGDGNTSTLQNPFHVYSYVGNFTVSLNVSSLQKPTRSSVLTKVNYITVSPAPIPPSTEFTGIPQSGTAPLNVTFTSFTTGTEPLTYAWDFGDGSAENATVQNPVHTYANVGTYNVSLTASNIAGSNTTTKINYITVGFAPIADFNGTPQSGIAPLKVTFIDNSTGTQPLTYAWDFGDGSTENATVQNPVHTYANVGMYNVSLTASNAFGSNTTTKSNYIFVGSVTKTGVFRGLGYWYLDMNNNGTWDGSPTDKEFYWGKQSGDIPITGDWNGNGITETGIFRPGGTWYFDMNNNGTWDSTPTDKTFTWGKLTGDIPITGDWNHDGTTETGIFRAGGHWYLDTNNNGTWDATNDTEFYWGKQPGDIPVTGDWTGDGITKTGIFRPGMGFYLDMNNNGTWDNTPTDTMLAWSGLSLQPNAIPATGDWNGDGKTETGIFQNGDWYLDINNNGIWDSGTDVIYLIGQPGDKPITGKWS